MLAGLAAVLLGWSTVDSTSRPISQLVHTKWTAKDGAPTDIRALAQTGDGYLWIGSLSGLVRFDGMRFVPFAPLGGDTVPTGGVRSLLTARDGTLRIVWRSGIVTHLRDGRLTYYGERDGLPVAYRLTESSAGTLVAGTANGLSRFADGKWKDVVREWGYPGTEAWSVWFDREDALWVETESRLVYLPSGTERFVDPRMPLNSQAGPADCRGEGWHDLDRRVAAVSAHHPATGRPTPCYRSDGRRLDPGYRQEGKPGSGPSATACAVFAIPRAFAARKSPGPVPRLSSSPRKTVSCRTSSWRS